MTQALVAVHHTSLGGVYYSNDINFASLGTQPTWAKYATTGLANTLIKRAQFDQFDPYNKVYVQLDNDTCYRWNGTSWTSIMTLAAARTAVGMASAYMGYIFVDKATAGTVYIPMSQDAVAVVLLKSVDYGANWTAMPSLGGLVTAVAYGQAAGQYLILSYGEVYRTFYYSSNGGASWTGSTHWSNSYGGGQIKQDPHRPDHCYYVNSASDYDIVDRSAAATTELQDGFKLAVIDHETNHWIDKATAGHQKIIRTLNNQVNLFATTDNWATMVTTTPTSLDSGTAYYGAIHCAIENVTYGMIGRTTNSGGGVQIVQAFVGDNPASMTGIAGTNYNTVPYTNAIPGATDCYVANCGIYVGVGAGAAESGVFVYADEEGDITDIPSYPNLGIPMFGDRASFRDLDADTDGLTVPTELSKYHAQDIRADTPQRHNIWPVANGNIEVSDGSKWVETTPSAFGIHAAVTLAADADTLLGLTGQQLTLDSKNANTVLAGPTSGAAADPAFRALGLTDLPAIALNDLSNVDDTGVGTGDIIYKTAGNYEDYPLGIGTLIGAVSGRLRIGNLSGGNYIEIDANGNLRLIGNATSWDDLLFPASVTKPGATAPSYKAFGPSGSLQALMFEAGHHDEVHFEVQLPHRWKEGSRIYPHVHWTPTDTTAGNVVWELEYAWANINGTFGAPSNMASDATAAGGTAWVHKMTVLKESGNSYIDGTGKTISSMLVCRLHRNSNAGSDTLNKDVALLDIDFHIEIDSFGSDLELVKDSASSLLLETGDRLLLESGDKLLLE